MSISKIAAAILVAGGVAAYGTSATANEAATPLSCMKISKQVKDALATHQQGSAFESATQEQKTGADYCMKGFYKAGMSHYEAALKLIGGSATAAVR